MDLYLDYNKFYQRIEDEYIKHGRLIIAVDYDDTIFDTYKRGETYDQVIALLKRWQPYADFVVWTASLPERYPSICEYCQMRGIHVAAINDNVPPIKYNHLEKCRKIYANVYVDDRAGLGWSVQALTQLIERIENNELCNE